MKKTDVISFLPLSEKKMIELDCLPSGLQLKKKKKKTSQKTKKSIKFFYKKQTNKQTI